ncbi:CDP-alcohol phosphatidyltransferase family protein [bacterium]|nr:CDP-alcohol phosphatidyltransferase family protein [bacterium]
MLGSVGRRYSVALLRPVVVLLNTFKVSCDALSLIGLFWAVAAGFFFAKGNLLAGGLLIIVSGIFDLMDGELARFSHKETRFGAFLDSSLDRYGDAAILCGIIYHFRFSSIYLVLGLATLVGAFLTSYTRARAEAFIDKCSVGLIERPERLILIILGGLFQGMEWVLWLLAILGNLTVIQRIIYIKKAFSSQRSENSSQRSVNKNNNN